MTKAEFAEVRTKYEGLSDHDLIIAHTVKLDTICEMFKNFNARFDIHTGKTAEDCEKKHESMDAKLQEMVDKKTFQWVIGVIIAVMFSIGATLVINQIDIKHNSFLTQANRDRLDSMSTSLNDIKTLQQRIYDKILRNGELK